MSAAVCAGGKINEMMNRKRKRGSTCLEQKRGCDLLIFLHILWILIYILGTQLVCVA